MRLIDGDMLIEWLEGRDDSIPYSNLKRLVRAGQFDIPSNQGEARLREALEFYASYWNHEVQLEDEGITSMQRDGGKIAREVLSSHTEDTEMPHKFDEDGLCINCRESIWSSSRQFCYLTSDITNGGSADD